MVLADHHFQGGANRNGNWEASSMVKGKKNHEHMEQRLNWILCPAWNLSISLWKEKGKRNTHTHLTLSRCCQRQLMRAIINHGKLSLEKLKFRPQAGLVSNTQQGQRQRMATALIIQACYKDCGNPTLPGLAYATTVHRGNGFELLPNPWATPSE